MSTKPCKVHGNSERYKRKGRIGACIKCHKEKNKVLESYYRSRDKNMMDYKWRLNKLCGMARGRAVKKERDFNISTEYLIELWHQQDGRCAISGAEFELRYSEDGGPHPDGPSLDRIDSDGGYVIGNVRLVTYHINTALSCFGEDRLLNLAHQIVKFNGSIG
ncbi:endonuclease [Pseudomonas phage PA11]|uniref:endonuclease n=1 Tax=Pseudomonas phage PA11 TaxID=347327 RepID=UPI0001554393|nr:endonuclease [Pseudomonas phage PA11]